MGDVSNLPDLLMVGDFDEFVQATHELRHLILDKIERKRRQ